VSFQGKNHPGFHFEKVKRFTDLVKMEKTYFPKTTSSWLFCKWMGLGIFDRLIFFGKGLLWDHGGGSHSPKIRPQLFLSLGWYRGSLNFA